MRALSISFTLLIASFVVQSQSPHLNFRGKVFFNSIMLDDSAQMKRYPLEGAKIILSNKQKDIKTIKTDNTGEFLLNIPAGGEYTLTVTDKECNSKRFFISTLNLIKREDIPDYNFQLESIVLSRPINGVNYSTLQQPLLKVSFLEKEKRFVDDSFHTINTINILQKLREEEDSLINLYAFSMRRGNFNLLNNNCSLAKQFYSKALEIFPYSLHAKNYLKKVENCN